MSDMYDEEMYEKTLAPGRLHRLQRDRVDIIADILNLLTRKAQRKTRIMYLINLSYEMLSYYLGELLRLELIRTDGPYYMITEKGKVFLGHYKDMKGVLSENIDKKLLEMSWMQ